MKPGGNPLCKAQLHAGLARLSRMMDNLGGSSSAWSAGSLFPPSHLRSVMLPSHTTALRSSQRGRDRQLGA